MREEARDDDRNDTPHIDRQGGGNEMTPFNDDEIDDEQIAQEMQREDAEAQRQRREQIRQEHPIEAALLDAADDVQAARRIAAHTRQDAILQIIGEIEVVLYSRLNALRVEQNRMTMEDYREIEKHEPEFLPFILPETLPREVQGLER